MPGQLAAHADVALAGLQVVDGADVVQASTGHIVPRGGVGAGHHPGGAQGDGMDLVDTGGGPQNIVMRCDGTTPSSKRGSNESCGRVLPADRGRKEVPSLGPAASCPRCPVHTGTRSIIYIERWN